MHYIGMCPGLEEWRWRSETCHQSETSEPICEIRAFQDGGPTDSQSSFSEEQLDAQDRRQRCLLYGANIPTISQSLPL